MRLTWLIGVLGLLPFLAFSENEPIPTNATVLVKASRLCGSEMTYFVLDAPPTASEVESLKWLLHFAVSEREIFHFEFHEFTGKYIKPDSLDQFLEKEAVGKKLSLEVRAKLTELKSIRQTLAELRRRRYDAKKMFTAAEDPEVQAAVERYWKSKAESVRALQAALHIKAVDTGNDCE